MTLMRVLVLAPLLLVAACDAASNGCIGNGDCMAPDKPFCDGLQCRGCMIDDECAFKASGPHCDSASGMCKACVTNAHCTDSTKPSCDAASGTCQGCVTGADCTDQAKPVCDSATHTCQPASMAQCSSDTQCGGSKPFCISQTCVACNSNARCELKDATKPTCDTTSGACRTCAVDSECESGVCVKPGDCALVPPVSGLTAGQCIPATMVKRVTPATITTELTGTTPYLKLDAGSYAAMTISRSVALIGTGRDASPSTTLDAVRAQVSNGQVSLVDLKVVTTTSAAVTCRSQTNLCLVRTRVDNTNTVGSVAVDASSDCKKLTMERSWARCLGGYAVGVGTSLSGAAVDFRLVNNLILQSGTATVPFAVSLGKIANMAGVFAYNSLLDNQGTVSCANSQTLTESVFAGPSGATAPSGCTAGADLAQSLMKPGDYTVDASGNPTFIATGTNVVKDVIDKAVGQLTPAIDYNGKARTGSFDRGAVEIK